VVVLGVVKLVLLYQRFPQDDLKIMVIGLAATTVLLPSMVAFLSMGRSDMSSSKAKYLYSLMAVAVVLAIPSWYGWTAYANDAYWMQASGDVAFIHFGPMAANIRIRQKFWRKNCSPNQ
jgi:heme/copper-type cytochrome/quinol oxidase subunit 4